MNYQFFGTALIGSFILWVVALVFLGLWFIGVEKPWYYKTTDLMSTISKICFLLPFAFWIVIGIICGLSHIWGWGLVR